MSQKNVKLPNGVPSVGHVLSATTKQNYKFLLIDDDEAFGRLMQAAALQRGISLEYYPSLFEMGRIGRLAEFDAAILDYFLDGMNGVEIAEYLEGLFGGKPVVLVSGRGYGDALLVDSPKCVKAFVHKVRGALTILDKAVEVAADHFSIFERPTRSITSKNTHVSLNSITLP